MPGLLYTNKIQAHLASQNNWWVGEWLETWAGLRDCYEHSKNFIQKNFIFITKERERERERERETRKLAKFFVQLFFMSGYYIIQPYWKPDKIN